MSEDVTGNDSWFLLASDPDLDHIPLDHLAYETRQVVVEFGAGNETLLLDGFELLSDGSFLATAYNNLQVVLRRGRDKWQFRWEPAVSVPAALMRRLRDARPVRPQHWSEQLDLRTLFGWKADTQCRRIAVLGVALSALIYWVWGFATLAPVFFAGAGVMCTPLVHLGLTDKAQLKLRVVAPLLAYAISGCVIVIMVSSLG